MLNGLVNDMKATEERTRLVSEGYDGHSVNPYKGSVDPLTEPRNIVFPEKACEAFKSELQRLEQLINESSDISSNRL